MQLTYSPAYDAYHSMFRILLVSDILSSREVEYEKIKILQFYIAFPSLLSRIETTAQVNKRSVAKVVQAEPASYAMLPSPRILYWQTDGVTEGALRALVAQGFFVRDDFINGSIVRSDRPIPELIQRKIDIYKNDHPILTEFIAERLSQVTLYGSRGLKAITGLMEFRYDYV